ncbi:uncharacterized protein J8A68_004479 [[Candida] subhashii]|uniref:Protein HOS4 n=1 Tax=[Candida] subhashii TaxID=561895 RepID=A0A8J5Q5W5_9ASCO|nr:uncharacterized protein J8A68_004479 [[Candida] subhashii]KAG7661979.1 hypothetical protein J8A68_004479 [[Candida] subhashii]
MSYNRSNNYYSSRYNKKPYDQQQHQQQSQSQQQPDQSATESSKSSTYIGTAGHGRDRDPNSGNAGGASPTSSSYPSRRDFYGSGSYRSRYESGNIGGNGSGSSGPYVSKFSDSTKGAGDGGGDKFYSRGANEGKRSPKTGDGSSSSSTYYGSASRRRPNVDRYESYPKYQQDKYYSSRGNIGSSNKRNYESGTSAAGGATSTPMYERRSGEASSRSDYKDDRRSAESIRADYKDDRRGSGDSVRLDYKTERRTGNESLSRTDYNDDRRSKSSTITPSSMTPTMSSTYRDDRRSSKLQPSEQYYPSRTREEKSENKKGPAFYRDSSIPHSRKSSWDYSGQSRTGSRDETSRRSSASDNSRRGSIGDNNNNPVVIPGKKEIEEKPVIKKEEEIEKIKPEPKQLTAKKTSFADYLKSSKERNKETKEKSVEVEEKSEAEKKDEKVPAIEEVIEEKEQESKLSESILEKDEQEDKASKDEDQSKLGADNGDKSTESKELKEAIEKQDILRASTDEENESISPMEVDKDDDSLLEKETETKDEEVMEKIEDTKSEAKPIENKMEIDTEEPKEEEEAKPTRSESFADMSALSSIDESDDDFKLEELEAIPETKEIELSKTQSSVEKDVDIVELSEAETVIHHTPPRIKKGRKLIRKKEYDEERHQLKRKGTTIESSEEESEEDDESDGENRESTPSSRSQRGTSEEPRKHHNRPPYKIKRDAGGRTLLQRACKKGNFADVKDYITRGASANEKDFCGFTCLHEAALEGHTEIVKYLIENGANVNAKADEVGDCETPLIDAAENKHLETVKVLLENGANPNIFNIDGFTALTKVYNEHADEEGYEEIIEVLEEATAKFNKHHQAKAASSSRTGSPVPIRVVEDPNDTYFADLIKRKGIYKYAAENAKEITANYFVSGNNLQAKPDILILAARNGHSELVDIILGLNPTPYDIDTESPCGVTALLASVGRGHSEVVESLLSKDADPFKTRKRDGLNALEIAQRSAHFDPKEVALIQKYMEKRSGNKVVETLAVKVASRITSRASSRAPSVPVSEDEEEEEKHVVQVDEDEAQDYEIKSEQEVELESESEKEVSEEEENEEEEIAEAKEQKLNKVQSNEEKKRRREASDDTMRHRKLKKIKSESVIKRLSSAMFEEPTPQEIQIDEEIPRGMSATPPPPSSSSSAGAPEKKQSAPISPLPLTKAQVEMKMKNAEEARIWQEKVEAKKKARREMFLKSEKEKEQKRKEEEEKRLEEERRIAKLKEEERLKLAKEAEAQAKALFEQRAVMKRSLTIEQYPIGLRSVTFNSNPTESTIEKYLPLYIFNIDNERYVVDLQVALLTCTPVSKIHEKLNPASLKVTDNEVKSKIWKLFFKFVGLDPKHPTRNQNILRKEGHGQFQNLLIHFIKFTDASSLLEEDFPLVYNTIWSDFQTKSIEVLLDSLCSFDDLDRDDFVQDGDMEIVIDAKSIDKFIPPHLAYRKDIIRTVSVSSRPLW